ncbi:phosphotransferase [Nocardia wallacei]|uniref:phosphotransferase n=1 Tax=Nocardia wallacei TaxID=480035 RepID=UPI002456BA9E|nr:phosphotransferase [Nocardia wallacei]
MPTLPDDLTEATRAAGVRLTEVLRRTDKTVLAAGEMNGRRVAVKCLLDRDAFWTGKWTHELRVYRQFADTPPPLVVPTLLHADDDAGLVVLEWLDGQRLDNERYPDRTLTDAESATVLSIVNTLNRWQPPADTFDVIFDYPDRFRRYHAQGFLTDSDLHALQRLLARAPEPDQLNHGDPLPSNILITGPGTATLLDWEFTGLFLPGFDLAMLYVLIGTRTDTLRAGIDDLVSDTGIDTAFVINLAAVLTRELRLHRELPDGPQRQSRLPVIEAVWAAARDRLHHCAGRG